MILYFSELITSVNIRLPFVEEDDRQEYLKDYILGSKNSSLAKTLIDEETGEKIVEMHHDVTTGSAIKRLEWTIQKMINYKFRYFSNKINIFYDHLIN